MRVIAVAAALLGLHAVAGFGQGAGFDTAGIDAKPGPLEFDAVSIKPADPGYSRQAGFGPSYLVGPRGNTVIGANTTLEQLIRYAYKVFPWASAKELQFGGPGWIRSERYDVLAKAPGPATLAELRMMTRNMLAERFRLGVRIEERPADVYVLEVGKNGPKFSESAEPPDNVSKAGYPWGVQLKDGTMDELAFDIALHVGCPVVNQTGLTGRYTLRMRYDVPPLFVGLVPGTSASASELPQPSSGAPSIFSAIQEQLGLKLTARKMPLPVPIVDRAERPTAN